MKNEKTNETAKQANKAADDVMQELDESTLDQVSGAGNPFANLPRVPTQSIDSDLRSKG